MSVVKEVGVRVARLGLGPLLLRAGARLGRGLVMCYHRIGPPQPWQVVRAVEVDLFRRQLEALAEIADLVPLAEVARGGRRPRPVVAITFDDDYRSHLDAAAPVLEDLGVPATFFVSGRHALGLGPYWWQHLEARIRADGLAATADAFGHPGSTPAQLAAALTATPAVAELESTGGATGAHAEVDLLDSLGIASLSERGHDIGFHTAAHRLLPTLDDDGLRQAFIDGRDEIEALVGARLDDIAYPHGQADRRVSRVAEKSFVAGWTGSGLAVDASTPRWQRGRWEAHDLAPERLAHEVALRLIRRTTVR